MAYSIEQIEIGVWLCLNSESLSDQLRTEFSKQLKAREAQPKGMYLDTYDSVLVEEMQKFLLFILSGMFSFNVEEIRIVTDAPYIREMINRIIERSIYE